MRGSLKYLLLIAALIAGAVLFACSSDDNGDDNGDEQPTSEEPADNGDEGDNGDNGDEGDNGDGSSSLADLAEQFGASEVKITYAMTGEGETDADDFEGEMVLYWKPPDRWRMDLSSADGDFSLIVDGDSALMCSAEGGEGQCFESPISSAIGIPFLSIFTNPDELNTIIDTSGDVDVSESSREIAGQDAACFAYSGTVEGDEGEAEVCFRDDGVLLQLDVQDFTTNTTFSILATDVEDSVSDDDLEPIYDTLDLSDIPGLEDIDLDEIPGLEP